MSTQTNFDLVLFGATGDLAMRKLLPCLYQAHVAGLLHPEGRILGVSRSELDTAGFLAKVETNSKIHVKQNFSDEAWASFIQRIEYLKVDVTEKGDFIALGDLVKARKNTENVVIYLSTAPKFFAQACENLAEIGLNADNVRVVLEKPLGTDLASSQQINTDVARYFKEEQIYRIDHYLGKEMIQSIFAVRFANMIFENVWNREHIDNVQITFAERLGVEERGGYYDESGALRDMVQNHTLQLLSLLAMDKPASFTKDEIRAEKIKVFKNLYHPTDEELKEHFIRGQYRSGKIDGMKYISYRSEPNVNPESTTETFASGAFFVDSDRFRGVPFFFRTGKRLTEKGTHVNIVFKQMDSIFGEPLAPNILTIYIQPTEGFSLSLNGKQVGEEFNLAPNSLDYRTDATATGASPEPYEKLIYDVLNNNSTNFSHWDEVGASWKLIDRIEELWAENGAPLHDYKAGSMGPQASFDLLEKFGAKWTWQPDIAYRQDGRLE